jgi:hypothetical protein
MKIAMLEIPIDVLKALIFIDESTGNIYWKERSDHFFKSKKRSAKSNASAWNKVYKNKLAFNFITRSGYLKGTLFGRKFYAHRVVYAYFNNVWPVQIDHIDGNKLNNKLSNLRNVDQSTNSKNLPKSKSNTTGFTGVHFDNRRKKFIAKLMVNKRSIHIGEFTSLDEAISARKNANINYSFHENHGRIAA